MQKKYNLALLPKFKNYEFIKLATPLAHIADSYLLGENSFPHVTLYQFHYDQEEIENLWLKIPHECKKNIILTFTQLNCSSFNNKIYWVVLKPNKVKQLNAMHNTVTSVLSLPAKQNYDPHLTLINTKDPSYEQEVKKVYSACPTISDHFQLALGHSDEIGQLIDVLYC